MELGFINFGQEELARKNKVLQMVRESTALDELGLGRIRDAFANMMFPGMSTLQRRAKYFVVMPSMFYLASKKNYNNVRDVHSQITKWEINLTQMLENGANNGANNVDLLGITGQSVLEEAKKDSSKFVKYDPAYIYMSGLRTYGMVKSDMNIYQLIFDLSSKQENTSPKRYKAQEEGEISDSDDLNGDEQLFSVCGEEYDFDKVEPLPLALTKKEADFLKERITNSEASKDSLFAYILNYDVPVVPQYNDLYDIWSRLKDKLPDEYMTQYTMGRRFSHLAYVIQLRYNYIMEEFNGQEEKAEELSRKIDETIKKYPEDFNEMLSFISPKVSEQSAIKFVSKTIKNIEHKDWGELDKLIIEREKAVKPGRTKLRNEKYEGNERRDPQMMSFRWNEIVHRVITDIRAAQ